MSGVKNLVSNTGALFRGDPFSQVKSPKANGVKLSTPSVASGECRASETDCESGAAGLALGDSQSEDQSDEAAFEDLAPATSGAGFSGACGAGAAMFIAKSRRVALPA